MAVGYDPHVVVSAHAPSCFWHPPPRASSHCSAHAVDNTHAITRGDCCLDEDIDRGRCAGLLVIVCAVFGCINAWDSHIFCLHIMMLIQYSYNTRCIHIDTICYATADANIQLILGYCGQGRTSKSIQAWACARESNNTTLEPNLLQIDYLFDIEFCWISRVWECNHR